MSLSALATLLQLGLNYVTGKKREVFRKVLEERRAPMKASVKITIAGYHTDIVFFREVRLFVLGLETSCHII
jgi:hypothetical protein